MTQTPLEKEELLRKNMGLDNRLMVKNIITIADNGEVKFFGITIKKGDTKHEKVTTADDSDLPCNHR